MNPMYFAGYYSIITTIQNGGESAGAEEAFYGEPGFSEETGVRDGEVRDDSGEPVVIEEQEPSPV